MGLMGQGEQGIRAHGAGRVWCQGCEASADHIIPSCFDLQVGVRVCKGYVRHLDGSIEKTFSQDEIQFPLQVRMGEGARRNLGTGQGAIFARNQDVTCTVPSSRHQPQPSLQLIAAAGRHRFSTVPSFPHPPAAGDCAAEASRPHALGTASRHPLRLHSRSSWRRG